LASSERAANRGVNIKIYVQNLRFLESFKYESVSAMFMAENNIEVLPVEHEAQHGKERICKDCGESFSTVPELATHSRYCEAAKERRVHEKAEQEGEQETTGVEQRQEEEDDSPYRDGEGEPNEILRHILTAFPGVSKGVVTEVMSWAELWGSIPPYYLPYLLGQMKGVSQGTANLITQKYTLATQKSERAQQMMGQVPGGGYMPPMGMGAPPGRMGFNQPTPMGAPSPMMGPSMGPYGFPRAPYGQGYGYQQPRQQERGVITKQDLEALEKRMREKSEIQVLKDNIGELTKAMSSIKNDIIREVGDSRTQYREIRVPINKAGEPCPPSEATSVRYEKVPMTPTSTGGAASSEILRRMDGLEKKFTDDTLNAIKKDLEDMKKGGLGGGRSQEYEKLEEKFEEQEKLIGSLAGQIEENKYNALLGEMEKLRTQIGRAGSGEWDSDEMKFVAKGLDRVADILENKKPVEIIRDFMVPQNQFQPPPHMEQPAQSATPLVERLRSEGLVTMLIGRGQ